MSDVLSRVKSLFRFRAVTTLFPSFPGTKDIRLHPVFKGGISKWAWKFYTHRLTRSGRWLLGLSLILMFGLIPSLDIQAFVPLVYISALWLVAIVICLVNRPVVRLSATHAGRVRAGETLAIEIEIVEAHPFLPGLAMNVLPERLPLTVDAEPADGTPLPFLARGETCRVRLGLRCPKRGAQQLWGYRVESDFPFGVLNAYRAYKLERTVLVHPDFEPLHQMDLPRGRRYQPGGVALAMTIGDSFEYMGNREYRAGDNIRDIDWRSTARHGGSPVALREYREEFFLRAGLVLDTHVPRQGMRAANRELREQAFERAVGLCAAIGDYLTRQDYIVDLFAAGPKVHHLTAGRGLAYLDQILDILACVEATPAEPLPSIAPQISDYVERLTTVICVFLEWDEHSEAFVDELRSGGVGVKVIVIPPETAASKFSVPPAGLPIPADATVIGPDEFRAGVTMF